MQWATGCKRQNDDCGSGRPISAHYLRDDAQQQPIYVTSASSRHLGPKMFGDGQGSQGNRPTVNGEQAIVPH